MQRRTGRRVLTAVIASGLVLAACGGGREPAARLRDQTVRWESVLVEDLGHSLTVAFTGGPPENLEDNLCAAEYEADVAETPDSVTITIHQLKLADPPDVDYGCDSVGYGRVEGIMLGGEGLAGRAIIDGHTGRTMTVIDETLLLEPTALADGWAEWYRGPDGAAMEIAYGPEGGDGFPPLSYTVAPIDNGFYNLDRDTLTQDLTTLEEIGVRGKATGAFLMTSQEDGARMFIFEEGGRFHRVRIEAGVDDAIALAFVESLD